MRDAKDLQSRYGAQNLLGFNDRARAARRCGSAIVVGGGRDDPNHLLLVVDRLPQWLVRVNFWLRPRVCYRDAELKAQR